MKPYQQEQLGRIAQSNLIFIINDFLWDLQVLTSYTSM